MNDEYQRVERACRELNSIPNGIGTDILWKYLFRQSMFYLHTTVTLKYLRWRYPRKQSQPQAD